MPKKSDLMGLLASIKVLCLQVKRYNEVTEMCVREAKARGKDIPREMEVMMLIANLTLEQSSDHREKVMQSLGLKEEV